MPFKMSGSHVSPVSVASYLSVVRRLMIVRLPANRSNFNSNETINGKLERRVRRLSTYTAADQLTAIVQLNAADESEVNKIFSG